MLTNKLQDSLSEKWQNCWPVSDLRPIALLDLISYLFFIKKADDQALIHQTVKAAGIENFIYTKETENFSWSILQNLNERDIHQLFLKKHGIIELMNNYAQLQGPFSDYFKGALLIEPTPKLLSNAIDIINFIETSDKTTRKEIAEYLFTKSTSSTENSEFVPKYILDLMTSIAEPSATDIIFDLAAGNGGVMISVFDFVNSSKSVFDPKQIKISGQESDVVQLRIAAMNIVLHGMKDADIFASSENKLNDKPTLIISALPSQEDVVISKNGNFDFAEKEIISLNDITANLSEGSRAVVLVSQHLLQSEDAAIVKIRKKLVDQFTLEGVITLPAKSTSIYSGAAILIFNFSHIKSENIWFYKWKPGKKNGLKASLSDENNNDDFEEAKNVLQLWKSRKDLPVSASTNSFFISANFLRSNNYNLSFNDYKLAHQRESLGTETANSADDSDSSQNIIATKKETLHDFFEPGIPLPKENQRRKVHPVLVTLLILICAAAFYWVYAKNTKNSKSKINHSAFNISATSDSNNGSIDINNKPTSSNDKVNLIGKSTKKINKESDTDSTKYTVKNKAWFHSKPDSDKIKPFYLSPRNQVVLTAEDDEDGFIYVVYTNSKGESTHGWLNKDDLQVVD